MNNLNRILEFLKESQTYYLGTIEDNKPKVRPFGTINLFEDKLYIQTGKSKDVFKQLMNNPNFEICAFFNGEWLRLEGRLIDDNRVEAKKAMLDNYPELRNMYDENDDNTRVFYISEGKASFYSFIKEKEEIIL